jgi:hypothetical protein
MPQRAALNPGATGATSEGHAVAGNRADLVSRASDVGSSMWSDLAAIKGASSDPGLQDRRGHQQRATPDSSSA